MVQLEGRDLSVIVEAHIEKYGAMAQEKAVERHDELMDLGDVTGAGLWKQVADTISKRKQSEPADL